MYNGKVVEYVKRKLETMRLDYIDSLLIHWPVLKYLNPTWEELVMLKEQEGLAEYTKQETYLHYGGEHGTIHMHGRPHGQHNIPDVPWPVSYTHLDVYKRQFLRRQHSCRFIQYDYICSPGQYFNDLHSLGFSHGNLIYFLTHL